MRGGGPAAVTLKLTGTKDSFLHLTPGLQAQLRLQQNHAVEVSWGEEPVFLGWMENRSRCHTEDNIAELNRQLGEKLGLSDEQQELHASALERHLLDQIRIVYPKAIFPVWVDQHTCIYIQIGALTPAASYGRLEALTELIVSPKIRDFAGISSNFPPPRTENLREASNSGTDDGKQTGMIVRSRESLLTEGESGPITPDHSDGFLTERSIWDTLGSLFYRASGKKPIPSLGASDKDIFAKTLLKSVRLKAIFRVSKNVPHTIKSSQAYIDNCNDNTVQVFLWNPEPPGFKPDVAITFGKITELPSPKRRQEKAKKSPEPSEREKQSGVTESNKPHNADIGASAMVKIVWHGFEELHDAIEYDTRNGNTHVGKVWVTENLRKKLNIDRSAAVMIQSSESLPSIPSSIALQPRLRLDRNITEKEIQSAFHTWLQSSSSLAVPWILGKTDHIQIPVEGEMQEFLIDVDHTSEKKSQDNIFMFCPSFLQETKIHVLSQPILSEEESVKPVLFDQNLSYLELQMSQLGGVDKLATSSYEHVVHCLLGRPLSRQLVATASGLRSGAILIYGAKGSGKSTLAKAVCKEAFEKLEAHVEEIDCKLLKGKTFENMRQTLEEAFAEAAWRQPSVLLLDDLDYIVGVPSTPELEQSPEAAQSKHLAHVLKDMMKEIISVGTLIAVVATSRSEHSLSPILISVQGNHIFQCLKYIQPPAQEQRSEMLRCVIQNRLNTSIALFQDLDLNYLAKETEGFVARDFTMLVERAIQSSVATRKTCRKEELALSMSDFQKALKGFTPLSLKNIDLHKPKELGWNMIGGLHDIRQVLKDTIELPAKYPDLFANLPIRHKSGVLLYGAPGTGKTLLAGVIAHESGMNFISIKGPELLSKYIGASEQALRDVFTRAQAAKPCILFFDEFDSIAPRRGHDNTGVTDRVVNQMLTQLDGVEGLQGVYVLAATSRPDLIDPALLRPGRLDNCLYCPPPDQMSRFEILKGLSHSMLLDVDVDFQQIAALTEHFTGADLKALLYNAQLEVIHASLAPSLPQDNCSGSDSDMSLSSIIFLNHSSGSEDSGGDTDYVLEQSLVSLDMMEFPPEDSKSSMWRLYFGSSDESDLGNGCSSDLTSQSLSGSNSITHDFTGLTIGELVPSQPLVFITSSQEDHQELNQEQIQKLNAEISIIKANYMNVEDEAHCQTDAKKKSHVFQHHLMTALDNTTPSISQEDWKYFNDLYEHFQNPKKRRGETFRSGQKVTLA
ncbi:peroxisomal ATPase PEX1 isoform X2 [Ascaphus truei]|uniref:peroxisomal ATPase PEX1 isoform X2 n=1 Tax=Ascaphus truei TaxID=8439 RepID=UPI003F59700E